MNAVTPTIADPGPLLRDVHKNAVERANAWRGRCIDMLTRGEAAVTDCLLRMLEDVERGENVKPGQLLGQRLQSLANAIGPEGPFAEDGKAAAARLDHFREHEALRTMLCHGKAKVLIDYAGRWTLILSNVEIRGGKSSRNLQVIHEAEGGEMAERLRLASQQLCAVLGKIPKR